MDRASRKKWGAALSSDVASSERGFGDGGMFTIGRERENKMSDYRSRRYYFPPPKRLDHFFFGDKSEKSKRFRKVARGLKLLGIKGVQVDNIVGRQPYLPPSQQASAHSPLSQ
jgi:hypothetical protein